MSMAGNVHVIPGTGNVVGIPMNYTGKNIHETSGSRTANTTNLLVGDVLSLDPHGQDAGLGTDLANPTAGFLDAPLWVVTQVPVGSETGGAIEAVPLSDCTQGITGVFHKATTTAGVTLLAATDMASASVNQRYLVAVTGSTTNATQIVDNTVKAVAAYPSYNSATTAARVDGSGVPLACFPI